MRTGKGARSDGFRIMIVLSAVLLGFGAAALHGVAKGSPAFSPDLRLAAPDSDWHPRSDVALFELYDNSRYLRARSEAFLRAAGDPDAGDENALVSVELALAGVEAAPADAYAWTLLAAAAASNGLLDVARTALARSRDLAPHNLALAFERITLASIHETPISDDVRAGLARDVTVARRYREPLFDDIVNRFPALAVLVDGNGTASRSPLSAQD